MTNIKEKNKSNTLATALIVGAGLVPNAHANAPLLNTYYKIPSTSNVTTVHDGLSSTDSNLTRKFPYLTDIPSLVNKRINLFEPKTEFGRKLLGLRKAAFAEGMKLLTADEIESFVKEVRSER